MHKIQSWNTSKAFEYFCVLTKCCFLLAQGRCGLNATTLTACGEPSQVAMFSSQMAAIIAGHRGQAAEITAMNLE